MHHRIRQREVRSCHSARYRSLRTPERFAPRHTVAIADGHPLFLASLSRSIRSDPRLELAARASNGQAALSAIRREQPDVAVIDIHLATLDGQHVLESVVADRLRTRVVILSDRTDGATVRRALTAGAAGYLGKEADEHEIHAAIIDIARGATAISARVQASVVEHLRATPDPRSPALSDRELETLTLASHGLTINRIASELSLSPHTIHTNLKRIYEKLAVNSQTGAIGKAMRLGLLT